jgi:photosystem II stability/assembly factor-like uncharacterized protein
MQRATLVVSILLTAAGCGSKPRWEALPLGTKADFRDITFTDAMNGWIAGGSYEITGGLVGRTSDGGKTWRYVSNLTERERQSVDAIHFFDSASGIAATGSGAILVTSDGGATWTAATRQGRHVGVSSLFFLDSRRGWAAGTGDVIRTDDGGQIWMPASTEHNDTSYRAPIRSLQFLDEQSGWVAGMQSYLARTSDGGGTWEPASIPDTRSPESLAAGITARPSFWSLFFIDSEVGWVVGEEGVMLSTADGGTTWTRRSTGLKDAHSVAKAEKIPTARGEVTLDAGDRTPGFTISAVRFIDRLHGWSTGFYPNVGRSLILRTDDGGATWSVDAEIAGEELYTLFIQGRDTAWAIGSRTREGSQAIYRRSVAAK